MAKKRREAPEKRNFLPMIVPGDPNQDEFGLTKMREGEEKIGTLERPLESLYTSNFTLVQMMTTLIELYLGLRKEHEELHQTGPCISAECAELKRQIAEVRSEILRHDKSLQRAELEFWKIIYKIFRKPHGQHLALRSGFEVVMTDDDPNDEMPEEGTLRYLFMWG